MDNGLPAWAILAVVVVFVVLVKGSNQRSAKRYEAVQFVRFAETLEYAKN